MSWNADATRDQQSQLPGHDGHELEGVFMPFGLRRMLRPNKSISSVSKDLLWALLSLTHTQVIVKCHHLSASSRCVDQTVLRRPRAEEPAERYRYGSTSSNVGGRLAVSVPAVKTRN